MFIVALFTNMDSYLKIRQGILLNIFGQIHLLSKFHYGLYDLFKKRIFLFVNNVLAAFTFCLKPF